MSTYFNLTATQHGVKRRYNQFKSYFQKVVCIESVDTHFTNTDVMWNVMCHRFFMSCLLTKSAMKVKDPSMCIFCAMKNRSRAWRANFGLETLYIWNICECVNNFFVTRIFNTCSTSGTSKWLENLHWANSTSCTFSQQLSPFAVNYYIEGYYKICGNLQYYSVSRSGHMVSNMFINWISTYKWKYYTYSSFLLV